MKDELKKQIIGFREWFSLPELGLVAVKGKIDTGAKTSSLHAYDIQVHDREGKKFVRFKVHPIQKDLNLVVECEAPLKDQRTVTNSGGFKEERYVIHTQIIMGGLRKKIELTLTNRESMKYRMLIGRAALKQFYIDPSQSYLLGKNQKQRHYLRGLKKKD